MLARCTILSFFLFMFVNVTIKKLVCAHFFGHFVFRKVHDGSYSWHHRRSGGHSLHYCSSEICRPQQQEVSIVDKPMERPMKRRFRNYPHLSEVLGNTWALPSILKHTHTVYMGECGTDVDVRISSPGQFHFICHYFLVEIFLEIHIVRFVEWVRKLD